MAITKSYSKDRKKCKVTFTLPLVAAPNAEKVKVLGDFNNWNWDKGVSLKATKTEFKGQVELTTGKEYQFKYQIDQSVWENDWAADKYIETPIPGVTNSVIVLENGVKTAPKAKTATKKTVAKKTAATVTKATKAAPVKRRTTKKAKDFTVIEGVGPKINGLLVEAGFKTFASLAKAKPANLKEVLKNAGSRYSMHDPTTWPKQANLAAAEKWDALKALQVKLSGGKKA